MVEQQRTRVEEAMRKLISDLDKFHLRKMQAEMHHCAAKCCENDAISIDGVHSCVDQCSVPLNNAQKYVQGELENLQDRLQRCVMQCNDTVKDKMGANPTEAEISRYSLEFEKCAIRCVDTHIDLIPNFAKKVKEVLSKGAYQK